MVEKKTIAIAGATGAQGGGLARAILADTAGPFSVRALTRHPESEKAKQLASLGAEIVASSPEQTAAFFRTELAKYTQVPKAANIRGD